MSNESVKSAYILFLFFLFLPFVQCTHIISFVAVVFRDYEIAQNICFFLYTEEKEIAAHFIVTSIDNMYEIHMPYPSEYFPNE